MTDEEFARYRALWRIFDIDRQGVVDGVEIDLRHELLNPQEWGTRLLGDTHSKYRSSREPFIWFPWFGAFDKNSIREEIIADQIKHGYVTLSKTFIDRWVRNHAPECFAYPGDRIVISQVERVAIGDSFDHPHDAEIRCAWLRIIRANGKSKEIATPLMFTGSTSLFAPRAGRDFFYKIAHRMCEHFGIKSLEEFKNIKEDESFAYGALSRARGIEYRTEKLRKLADDLGSRSREHHNAFSTWSLANDAVAVGYLWAKAEADLGLKPLAETILRVKAGASLGGNKSGEARRIKRTKTWEPHARELAKGIRGEHPSFSQDRVASEIEALWKESAFSPPGHKTLKVLLSEMEQRGELPARKAVRKRSSFR